MNREIHVRFCEGLGCNSLGLLTYGRRLVQNWSILHAGLHIQVSDLV